MPVHIQKKTSLSREHMQKAKYYLLPTDRLFLLKWIKYGKELIHRKENWGHQASERVNCRQSEPATFRAQKGGAVTMGDVASGHILSPFFVLSSLSLLHVLRGRPRFLLCSGTHVRATRGCGWRFILIGTWLNERLFPPCHLFAYNLHPHSYSGRLICTKCLSLYSLFQALGSWGREKERNWGRTRDKRGRNKARNGQETVPSLALVLPRFFSRSPSFFHSSSTTESPEKDNLFETLPNGLCLSHSMEDNDSV